MTRTMPAQKPGASEQVVGTPPAFLTAVERRFGPIRWDLAATHANTVLPVYHYGPGSKYGENALTERWAQHGGVLWLNPEFSDIDPWAAKSNTEGRAGARVKMLVPASVGTDWWAEHVHYKAMVLFLRPRLTFIGHTDPYPKDLALCCYGPWVSPGYNTWRWDHETEAAAP
jgi:phage N-6-adenine-methyltransferase